MLPCPCLDLDEVGRIEAAATDFILAPGSITLCRPSFQVQSVLPSKCRLTGATTTGAARSMMTTNPARKAEGPTTNTVLNYLYRIAARELRLTLFWGWVSRLAWVCSTATRRRGTHSHLIFWNQYDRRLTNSYWNLMAEISSVARTFRAD